MGLQTKIQEVTEKALTLNAKHTTMMIIMYMFVLCSITARAAQYSGQPSTINSIFRKVQMRRFDSSSMYGRLSDKEADALAQAYCKAARIDFDAYKEAEKVLLAK